MFSVNQFRTFALVASFLFIGLYVCRKTPAGEIIKSERASFSLIVIADSIQVPFGMAFLSEDQLLATDRATGRLLRIDVEKGSKTVIKGAPDAFCNADGGLLDVALHPQFDKNRWIYLSFSVLKDSVSTMVVERAQLSGDSLTGRERIFTALPWYKEPNHFGTRMVFSNQYLFITMGDRYFLRDSAQSLANHLGKVIRLYHDGRVPDDNPFVNVKGAKAEIWSIGHRNAQGLAVHPETGDIWEHEHGPKGGDEINIVRPGLNYGWPVVCYGIDYDDTPIGSGRTSQKGMEEPLYYYTPSIAPSGMVFYTGSMFPEWQGSVFIGAMALRHLNRLEIKDNKVVHEERLLSEKKWRIRNVVQAPDGSLYISTDGGQILRLAMLDD